MATKADFWAEFVQITEDIRRGIEEGEPRDLAIERVKALSEVQREWKNAPEG